MPLNDALADLVEGSDVTLGIRPRNLSLNSSAQPDSLSMTIDLIEPMGAETLAHLKSDQIEQQGLRVVTDWKTPLTEGQQVHAQFAPGSTHIFGNDEQLVTTI